MTMKKRVMLIYIIIFFQSLYLFSQDKLEDIYMIELGRLEETWNILDQGAENVWNGWKGYEEVPFIFNYPNGVRLLVGYPEKPEGFEEVTGLTVRDKKVFIDRREEIPLKLEPPLLGGGGVRSFGPKRIRSVYLTIRQRKDDSEESKTEKGNIQLELASENQILINIHELFHVFQRTFYRPRFGNFRYNPDLNYALYSDLEGKALEKAYLEKDDDKTRDYLKDFIIAREQKRKTVDEYNRNAESADGFMEGTAVYSEFMTLLTMKKKYDSVLNNDKDPYFYSFENIDYYLNRYLKSLKENQSKTFSPRGKCYYYGCFQALLLTRLYPDWIDKIVKEQKFMDEIISEQLDITEEEMKNIKERFKTRYYYDSIYKKHSNLINERDQVISQWKEQEGKAYIINFKKTGEYLTFKPNEGEYSAGIIYLYPKGIQDFKMENIILKTEETLIEKNQLYFIRWIDTKTPVDENGYTIKYDKKEGENIYYNATIKTNGFSLFAPKVEIKEGKKRVKITILSKI